MKQYECLNEEITLDIRNFYSASKIYAEPVELAAAFFILPVE